jgi:DnaA family protein
MRQLILDLLPADPPSFDNFVTGSNAEALTGLAAWLAPTTASPCSLSGAKREPASRICCRPAGRVLRCAAGPATVRLALAQDPYAVDHLEALGDGGQIVLFNLINRLRASGGRLLAAADVPPSRLDAARGSAHPPGQRPGLPPAAR